ncbi:polysaccharide deacetylase family protein [Sphingomonas sp. T9W2]|uniref:polysaccharide deacetylase family protein n=1 Tax=Sphingomonas sp. T9W2 TaxID=3143183 RepID=UPI0031F518C3
MVPFRPAQGRPVTWRDGFGTRFTVFVDTEEEFDWRAPFRHDGWGVSAVAALPAAHRRFAGHGVQSCYLVDYPVASDPAAIDALRGVVADGHATIGAQLHPWVNPPFDEALTAHSSFAGNLPPALEAAKLDRLTDALTRITGARPNVYRAGRYGLGPATLGLLAARGYALDSSMRARYDYRAQGGPDYRAIGNDAFHTGPGEGIVELPLTTVFTGRLRRGGQRLYKGAGRVPRGRGVLARLGLLHRVALTPEDMPLADALEAVRVAVGEGVRVLNFAYHSPSLVPGHTPYVRDAADLAAFWRWWDAVLSLLGKLHVQSASPDDILAAAT